MRKAAPLLFILMLMFSLPAQQRVSSNSIGQDRERFAQGGSTPFCSKKVARRSIAMVWWCGPKSTLKLMGWLK